MSQIQQITLPPAPTPERDPLARLSRGGAVAFLVAVVAVYPLYIDRFSNLGLTKFSGVYTLFVLFCLALGSCRLVGAAPLPGRYTGRDLGLCALGAFVASNLVSTCFSLSPASSLWGLGSYYGGLALVMVTALGYLCIRSFAQSADLPFFTACVGATVIVVAVLYTCNIFNIDLIGTYANTAVVERAQFFSTLGQKDFNAGYLSVVLPLVFWAFLEARGLKRTIATGIPALFGALSLAVVDAEGLLLGVSTAIMLVICHRTFGERQMRRVALVGAMFFACAGWMHYMRATVYTQGGTSVLAEFGAPYLALPGGLGCLAIWLALVVWGRHRTAHPGIAELRFYRLGRAVTVIVLSAGALLVLLANFLPGFPSLGKLDGYFVFNGDWGTYRGTAWQATAAAWWDAPFWRKLLGYGPSVMHTAVLNWAGADATERLKTFYAAHNEYLEQLLTTGLVGLAAWLAFIAAHLRRGLRHWYDTAAAPLVLALCSYLIQAIVSIRVSMVFPEVMLLFGLLAAVTAPAHSPAPAAEAKAASHGKKAKKAALDPAAERKAQWLFYGKIALAAIAAMVVAPPLSHVLLWFLF